MKKKEEKKNENKPQKVMHNLIIMDESGSMDRIKEQALNGANETIKTIRKAQEEMPDMLQKLTFVTFDSLYDGTDVRTIFDDLPIDEVRDLHERDYCPCGGTPLYDAMGFSLSKLQEQVQPGEHALVPASCLKRDLLPTHTLIHYQMTAECSISDTSFF